MSNIQKLDPQVILPIYKRYPIQVKRAKGVWLTATDGKRYLDFQGGFAVNALGYRHPQVMNAARKMLKEPWHISGVLLHENPVRLAQDLLRHTGMARVFFQSSGAECVEAAIKVARAWGNQQPQKRVKLLALTPSFHGRTTGAVTLTGVPAYQEPFLPLLPEVYHVPVNDVDALNKTLDDTFAAVFVEPILGESGIIPLSQPFMEALARRCEETGTLLVADEIQSGAGRAGAFLACEGTPLKPDMVLLAKGIGGGLPLGAWLVNEKLIDVLKPGDHGTTYGGNVFVTGVSRTVVRLLVREAIPNVRALAPMFEQGLRELQNEFEGIEEVRGRGFMWGVQFKESAKPVWQACLREGLLLNLCGEKVLRLLPALILTEDELKKGLKRLRKALASPVT